MVRSLAAEAILLVDFGDKLAHARSIPEVRKIYKDTTVQLKIATKDAKRVIDDNEAAAEVRHRRHRLVMLVDKARALITERFG